MYFRFVLFHMVKNPNFFLDKEWSCIILNSAVNFPYPDNDPLKNYSYTYVYQDSVVIQMGCKHRRRKARYRFPLLEGHTFL